jgi:dolichol-phosphate mannosyltransferase
MLTLLRGLLHRRALANVSVASWIYAFDGQFYVAGLLGVLMSVVFNYSVTKVFTWR